MRENEIVADCCPITETEANFPHSNISAKELSPFKKSFPFLMSILNVKNEPLLSGDFWQNMSRQFPPKYSSLGCTVTVVSTICY